MKTKINLHNRPNGRIDTYQPYSIIKQERSDTHSKGIVVDRESRLRAAYSSNYSQACILLQAIQMHGRRKLGTQCILQLADFVAKSWESNPGQEKIEALAKLMTNLLETTLLCPEKPFDEALKEFCRSTIPTHSVSPSITLLIAIGYIERLKQKYTNFKGTAGCGHRLIMVAYMMAAKYMHVNLQSIINTSTRTGTAPTSTTLPAVAEIASHEKQVPISAERSTISNYTQLPPILLKNEQLPSPPTSPKAYSDSDPLKYHYFHPPSQKSTSSTTNNTQNFSGRHFQILRMELEFLHFLNYDLSLSDTLKLVHWAQKFDDDLPAMTADEGDDESETASNH